MNTSEKDFEASVEAHLLANGYTTRPPQAYDRALCLDSEPLFDFLYATQPKTWDNLKQQHGDEAKARFLKRLTREIETRGTLDVLRKGVTDLGCKFDLAYFQPESGLNEEHQRLYAANVPSVMRQVDVWSQPPLKHVTTARRSGGHWAALKPRFLMRLLCPGTRRPMQRPGMMFWARSTA